jgi:GT2 family glycosyltransferase
LLDAAPIGNSVLVLTSSADVMTEHALYLFADAANRGIRFAYGDAELVDTEAKTMLPLFKPSFSPLHQQLNGYIGRTILVDNRDATFTEVVAEFVRGEGTLGEVISEVGHQLSASSVERLPFVVTSESAIRIVDRTSEIAELVIPDVRVSIIIPTRDRLELLRDCIDSLLAETRYPRDLIQIIVVDNGSVREETLSYLRSGERRGDITVLRDKGDFNFPRLNNRAAEVASGEVLVLLNNDTTVLEPLWLARMVREAIKPTTGVVGAKLLFEDYSVQHGGVVLGIQGVAAHVNHTLRNDDVAYHDIANLTHEVSAVTGACIAIRSDVYREIGGLDESLAVAFNDIDLCCASIELGYKNVYIGSALMFHHESKSRGYDLKPEQQAAFRAEAVRARSKHLHLYRDDPYYNPNLSLERPYDLAEPPRAVRPWILERRRVQPDRCILMLSSTHQIGHGVAVVIDIQARYLASLGHRVILGGPLSANDFAYEGCERIELHSDVDAAKFAFECGADVVMMHTPPFFGAARWLGEEQLKVAYDYGEPPPDMFPDAIGRRSVLADKQFSIALADRRFGISEAVRDESNVPDMGVIPLGNSHLATWSEAHLADREATRRRHGWSDKLVVLNVCRFHRAERHYKGVDAYAALFEVMRQLAPQVAERVVFVLCGKGNPSDVEQMEAAGLVVRANVTDAELIELYAAADTYVNLSRWEGYNLGIGQALAMGLPVLASHIPAHRAFGIMTSDDVAEQVGFIEQQVLESSSSRPIERHPRVWDWAAPLAQLARLVLAT